MPTKSIVRTVYEYTCDKCYAKFDDFYKASQCETQEEKGMCIFKMGDKVYFYLREFPDFLSSMRAGHIIGFGIEKVTHRPTCIIKCLGVSREVEKPAREVYKRGVVES